MARFNEILTGRYSRFLQKLLSMKGQSPMPQLASELVAVLPFFNGAENRYLEGWDRFGATQNSPAVAAQTSGVRLHNPKGSNVIAVVEKATGFEATADTLLFDYNLGDTDLATPLPGIRLDSRGRANSSTMISSGNNVATNGFLGAPYGAGGFVEFIVSDIQEMLLLPGDSLQIRTTAVNVALRGSFMWRERALEESERF